MTPKSRSLGGRAYELEAKAAGDVAAGKDDGSLRRGGSDGTPTQGALGNWGSPRRPVEKSAEAEVGPITGSTGKRVEGGRMEDGPVVAMKAGNAAGAKGPCRSDSFVDKVRQG